MSREIRLQGAVSRAATPVRLLGPPLRATAAGGGGFVRFADIRDVKEPQGRPGERDAGQLPGHPRSTAAGGRDNGSTSKTMPRLRGAYPGGVCAPLRRG